MGTPGRPLLNRLINISRGYWTIFRPFEIVLEWELSLGLEFKSNILCKPIVSKTFNLILIKF